MLALQKGWLDGLSVFFFFLSSLNFQVNNRDMRQACNTHAERSKRRKSWSFIVISLLAYTWLKWTFKTKFLCLTLSEGVCLVGSFHPIEGQEVLGRSRE